MKSSPELPAVTVVGNLDELSKNDLGLAEQVEETKIGDSEMTFITGCKNPKAISIIIRGGTQHVIDEVDRALHDALRVVGVALEDGKVVAGGGAPEDRTIPEARPICLRGRRKGTARDTGRSRRRSK